MYLGANTFIYIVGEVSLKEAFKSIKRLGFKYIDFFAYRSGDPTQINTSEREDIVKMYGDYGFTSSQMLLFHTQHLATSDSALRVKMFDYMKRCVDFQLELGGKQILLCWGGGILFDTSQIYEQAWVNSVSAIREITQWCLDKGIYVELELDPHVYFVVNNLEKMVKMIEDVDMPNLFSNIDIGHLAITREPPNRMRKLKDRILHVHLSETDALEHTNSILGSGKVDFKSYIDTLLELGIEENCKKYGVPPVAAIELGDLKQSIDDPERWVRESLAYIRKKVPELIL